MEYTPAGIADSAATFLTSRVMDPATRDEAVSEYLVNSRQELFFLKTDDWATEHEFRAVLAGSDDEYAYFFFKQALVAVILGEHFPEWQVAGAREICDEGHVALKRVGWLNGRPWVGKA